jgi:hypothetical protein
VRLLQVGCHLPAIAACKELVGLTQLEGAPHGLVLTHKERFHEIACKWPSTSQTPQTELLSFRYAKCELTFGDIGKADVSFFRSSIGFCAQRDSHAAIGF